MEITVNLVLVLAMRFLVVFPGYSSVVLMHYLHPESQISAEFNSAEFTESTACWAAVFHLTQAGVNDIKVCEVKRIEAPLSGYLVDAVGHWDSGHGDIFTVFRIGVHDGQELPFPPGEEFVFLAAGFLANGDVFLYPEPVVTADSIYQFVSAHEFLMDRDEFFTLPERYSR